MNQNESLNNAVLERLAALGVNVYDLPAQYTADHRNDLMREASANKMDTIDYALHLVDIINRCETRLSNDQVIINDLKEAVADW